MMPHTAVAWPGLRSTCRARALSPTRPACGARRNAGIPRANEKTHARIAKPPAAAATRSPGPRPEPRASRGWRGEGAEMGRGGARGVGGPGVDGVRRAHARARVLSARGSHVRVQSSAPLVLAGTRGKNARPAWAAITVAPKRHIRGQHTEATNAAGGRRTQGQQQSRRSSAQRVGRAELRSS